MLDIVIPHHGTDPVAPARRERARRQRPPGIPAPVASGGWRRYPVRPFERAA